MRTAKLSVMHPDLSTSDLGSGGCDSALDAFGSFPWEEELRQAQTLDQQGKDCVDPEITLTVGGLHLTVAGTESNAFRIEVCVPRPRRLLGLIGGVETYRLAGLDAAAAEDAIRSFMSEPHDLQHSRFSRLAASPA